MSGGSWDYSGYIIEEKLQDIANEPEVEQRFPVLSYTLIKLSTELYEIEHELDWDLSGDTHIKNDIEWEKYKLKRLRDIITE